MGLLFCCCGGGGGGEVGWGLEEKGLVWGGEVVAMGGQAEVVR